VRLRDGRQQAKFVIQQIRERLLSGQTPKDVAVLYRSHFHAMELQLELAREGMPYVITSGVRFFEQAHVKDACTVLRLIRNAADELAFLRLLELFPRVGKRTAAKIWDGIGRRFDPLQPMSCKTVGERLPKIARPLWETMTQQVFIDYADEKLGAGPGGVIEAFLSAFYDQYAVETFDNYERRQEDLQELVTFSNQFETVDDFLNEMALLTNLDTEAGAGQAMPEDSIRLSTVHQAKGLEWKTVFILWVADMFFPSGRSLNDAGGEAEERRLFYVATTRAKDELMLCIPQMRRNRDGSVQFCDPSRFVSELDASLFSVVDPEYIYT
jgi:DNA helicase-2/ATP-dependent DNA helicase PcrA